MRNTRTFWAGCKRSVAIQVARRRGFWVNGDRPRLESTLKTWSVPVTSKTWSADKIIDAIGDIATSPDTKWFAQTGTGGIYTAKGDPAKWVSYEVRDGVRIRVVYQPATGRVITGFPDDQLMPPYKPIK